MPILATAASGALAHAAVAEDDSIRVVARVPASPDQAFSLFVRNVSTERGGERDTMSQAIRANGGQYESQWVEMVLFALRHARREGDTPALLDVGANLGVYTLSAAALGYRVFAFEPMARNGALLAASIAANRRESGHVSLFRFGLSDADRMLCIRPTSSLDAGNGQLSRSEAACGKADQHVLVRRLDTAATSEPALQGGAICSTVVMKLDTEGAEPLALLGAERVLFAACPPCLVMFEYKPIAVTKVAGGLTSAREAFAMLMRRGYSCRPAHYRSNRHKPGLLSDVRLGRVLRSFAEVRAGEDEWHCVHDTPQAARCAPFLRALRHSGHFGYTDTWNATRKEVAG